VRNVNLLRRIIADIKTALKVNLLAGLLFLMPLVATFYFVYLLVTWVDKSLLLLPAEYRPENLLPFPVPGLGFVLVFSVLFLTGFLVRNFIGRRLVALGDFVMAHIPFVSKFYSAFKQLFETVLHSGSRDFKRVVLLEYPRRGVYTLGFVTGSPVEEIQRKISSHCINVFVPTTPNPTSGFYLIVPEEDLIPLNMSVEESFKVLISGGILNPETSKKGAKPNAPSLTVEGGHA